MMLATLIQRNKTLRLFDTFGDGLPDVCEFDNHHKKGDFSGVDFNEIINSGGYFKIEDIMESINVDRKKESEKHLKFLKEINFEVESS